MFNHFVYVYWYHWVGACLLGLGALLPVVLLGGRRLGYCAALSGLGLAAVLTFWIVDRNATERLGLIVPSWAGNSVHGGTYTLRIYLLEWSGGEAAFWHQSSANAIPAAEWDRDRAQTVPYDYLKVKAISQRRDASDVARPDLRLTRRDNPAARVQWRGFTLLLIRGPTGMSLTNLSYLWAAAPMWFPAVLLLLVPAWWFYRRNWGIERRRFRRGLCVKCGYSRRGIPADSRCPECGEEPQACGLVGVGGGGSAGVVDWEKAAALFGMRGGVLRRRGALEAHGVEPVGLGGGQGD